MAQDKKTKLGALGAEDKAEPSLPLPGNAKEAVPAVAKTVAFPPLLPPPLPDPGAAESALSATAHEARPEPAPEQPSKPAKEARHKTPARRVARRRPAGPVRGRAAANDDGPSIGGLIYALQQKPSNKPFKYAAVATMVWAAIGIAFGIVALGSNAREMSLLEILSQPTTFLTTAALLVPIAVLWFLALLAWRTDELRLRSSTMTEVAVRLAEPDRMAEQSVASLGQAVRRQVSFMNDAVSRALGRAGELEALVHNEVSVLERSYEENESKIRNLISELSGERHALVNTSDRVSGTLRDLGTEIPSLIEKLSDQQVKLAQIIQGAGENLTSLETSLASSVGNLETSLGGRADQIQNVLENYTTALDGALGNRTEQMQIVLEEYALALDTTLANRAEALDFQLVERTKSLDDAFAERLRLFDDSIMRSTAAIDSAVLDKAQALTTALDSHAISFRETIGKQAADLDESLMLGINSVRRSSENITRQSIKAMEGLAGQSEVLKNVSENLLGQIHNVTGRFENQGQAIFKAANALENANFKIDSTLQSRHAELSKTLERLSGKADEFGHFVEGYSSSIEGSLTQADTRARTEIERMREQTTAESERALGDLKSRLSSVSSEVTAELGSLTNSFAATSDEMRQQAARAAAEIAAEQERLREQMERLPVATQENSETMRRALQDQLKALDQLSQLTARTAQRRDVTPPMPSGTLTSAYANEARVDNGQKARALTSLSSSLTQELGNRQRRQRSGAGRPDAREGWSLGDLLARASMDEDGAASPGGEPRHPHSTSAFNLNLQAIAHALDTATAAAIWSRLRAGQRGVMVRSIYAGEGQAIFDDVSHRCRMDGDLVRTITQYLTDFERIISESDARDPSGRLTQSHLASDTGRVYLFLGHASGRLG